MITVQSMCLVSGSNFSPKLFMGKSSVMLVDAHESGVIGGKGRYKGVPIPYGAATIEYSNKVGDDWSTFTELLKLIESCIGELRDSGAESINIWLNVFHDSQCSFEISSAEIELISKMKLGLSISCYEEEANEPDTATP